MKNIMTCVLATFLLGSSTSQAAHWLVCVATGLMRGGLVGTGAVMATYNGIIRTDTEQQPKRFLATIAGLGIGALSARSFHIRHKPLAEARKVAEERLQKALQAKVPAPEYLKLEDAAEAAAANEICSGGNFLNGICFAALFESLDLMRNKTYSPF